MEFSVMFKTSNGSISMDGAIYWRGVMAPLNNFKKKISILIGTNLVILFNKITFSPLNNVINSFKINVIATNFFTTFLQIIEVANF